MIKQILSLLLRRLHLLESFDYARFIIIKFKSLKENNDFKKEFPGVVLPPDFILYESSGRLNYNSYYLGGQRSASSYVSLFQKNISLNNAKICEWGCGPGRVIRHFPDLLAENNCRIFGTDYNMKTIEWNKKNLGGIDFSLNSLVPPLSFPNNFFDAVFAISVFTHLSEKLHYEWFDELIRVTRPGGIIIITTHGNNFKDKLLPSEKRKYEEEELVIRSTKTEGIRTYTAFHNPSFMKKLIGENEILEHIEDKSKNRNQDKWVIKRKS